MAWAVEDISSMTDAGEDWGEMDRLPRYYEGRGCNKTRNGIDPDDRLNCVGTRTGLDWTASDQRG